jgi:hypothetical protein
MVSIAVQADLDNDFTFSTVVGTDVERFVCVHGFASAEARCASPGEIEIELRGVQATYHPEIGSSEQWIGRWIRVVVDAVEIWRGMVVGVGSRGYGGYMAFQAKTRMAFGTQILPKLYEDTRIDAIVEELVTEGDFPGKKGASGAPYARFDDPATGFDTGLFYGSSGFSDVYPTGQTVNLWGMHLPEIAQVRDVLEELMIREHGYFLEWCNGTFEFIPRGRYASDTSDYDITGDDLSDYDYDYGASMVNEITARYVIRSQQSSQQVVNTSDVLAFSLKNGRVVLPVEQPDDTRRMIKPDSDLVADAQVQMSWVDPATYTGEGTPWFYVNALYEQRGMSVVLTVVLGAGLSGRGYLRDGVTVTADVYDTEEAVMTLQAGPQEEHGRSATTLRLDGFDDSSEIASLVDWILGRRSEPYGELTRVVLDSRISSSNTHVLIDVGDVIGITFADIGVDHAYRVWQVARKWDGRRLTTELLVQRLWEVSAVFDSETHGFDDSERGFYL